MNFKHLSHNYQKLSAVMQTNFFIKYKLYPHQCFGIDFFYVDIKIHLAFSSLICSLTGEIQCFAESF